MRRIDYEGAVEILRSNNKIIKSRRKKEEEEEEEAKDPLLFAPGSCVPVFLCHEASQKKDRMKVKTKIEKLEKWLGHTLEAFSVSYTRHLIK
jgi:hypothetical protein